MAIISASVVVPWTPPTACVIRTGVAQREVTAQGLSRDTITLNAKVREQITVKALWRQCTVENS